MTRLSICNNNVALVATATSNHKQILRIYGGYVKVKKWQQTDSAVCECQGGFPSIGYMDGVYEYCYSVFNEAIETCYFGKGTL